MLRKIRLLTAGVAVAACAAAVPAGADPSDLGAATLTTVQDQLYNNESELDDPDVTCDVEAGGRDVVQHTNVVFGEVYGQDLGIGQGECVSLDRNRNYSVTLHVQIEYFTRTSFTDGYWTPVPNCFDTTYADSVSGVAAPPPAIALCAYTSTSPYLNRYHRAHAILTPHIYGAQPRHAYSPVWYMAP